MTLLVALALSLDAAAVSAGLGANRASMRMVWAAALTFGLFQGGMAAMGAWGGAWLASWASSWDHWLAFGLLVVVGGRMVLGTADEAGEPVSTLSAPTLIAAAVATSIDALAAGVTLPHLRPPLWLVLLVITATTSICCLGASLVARRAGAWLGPGAERVGGLVLIVIGVQIVAEHIGWP